MENKIDTALLQDEGKYSFITDNIGKIIAVLTAAIAVLLTFAEIALPSLITQELSLQLILMLVSSYVIYFSLEDSGERLGRGSAEYTVALLEYKTAQSELSPEDLLPLREYCTEYREAELLYRKKSALLHIGHTEAEYAAWLAGEAGDGATAAKFKKIKRMKPIELSPTSLISGDSRCERELTDPSRTRLVILLLKLLPSTVCTLFTVSVMINARADLTVSAVIEGIIKLATLPIVALRGYSDGYNYTQTRELGWIRYKTALLRGFLSKREKIGGSLPAKAVAA